MDEPTTDKAARAKLYGKISAVTAAVSRIPKNGFNAFHKYKYATESDITDGLRDLLEQHRLAFLPPSVLGWERSQTVKRDGSPGDDLTRVQMQFEIGCCDTGEVYTAIVWGEGQDSGDKGFYKAYTGAVKYFLMKTFLIATGDDPEQDAQRSQNGHASYNAPTARQQPRPQPQQRQAPPTTDAAAPLCEIHRTSMRPGKNGGWFCATKLEDGKWCEGRSLKPETGPTPPTNGAPKTADEAEQRFYARYAEIIGGRDWAAVRRFLRSSAPKPTMVEGWIAAGEAVRDQAYDMPRAESGPGYTIEDDYDAIEAAQVAA